MSDIIWIRNQNLVGTPIDDSFVMLDIDRGEYTSLNASAADVWHALEQPKTAAQIVDVLLSIYNVAPEQCASAVARILDTFEAKGLIKPGA